MRSKLSILLILFLFVGKDFAQEESSVSQNLTYISAGMSLQMVRLQKQDVPINQFSFPITIVFPVGHHIQMVINNTPAISSWADTANIRISGLSDTWIQGTYIFWKEKAFFNIGIGVPTGKSSLNDREFLLSQLLDDNISRFRLPAYSQGLCRKIGVAFALPVSESAIIGVGGEYVNHQAFVPVRYVYEVQGEERVSEEEYKPGDEISINFGLDLRLKEDMKLMMDGIFTSYSRDLLSGQEIYGSGEKLLLDFGYLYQFSQQYFLGRLRFRKKGKNGIWQGLAMKEELKNSNGPETEVDLVLKVVDVQNGALFFYGDGRFYGANQNGIGQATIFGGGFGLNYELSEKTNMNFKLKFLSGKRVFNINDKRDIVIFELFLGWDFKL